MKTPLLSTLDSPSWLSYFLLDAGVKVAQAQQKLTSPCDEGRIRVADKILREAGDTEVGQFTVPLHIVITKG